MIQFPFVKNVNPKLLSDDLIPMRPDETWEQAKTRYFLKQRKFKINKIVNRIIKK